MTNENTPRAKLERALVDAHKRGDSYTLNTLMPCYEYLVSEGRALSVDDFNALPFVRNNPQFTRDYTDGDVW